MLAGLARPAEEGPVASREREAAGTSKASAEQRVQDPEPKESLVEDDLRSMAESGAVSARPGCCTSLLSGRVQARTAPGILLLHAILSALPAGSKVGKCLDSLFKVLA